MNPLDIIYLVNEFYAIVAVSAMLTGDGYGNYIPMRHSHSRWYKDFCDFRDAYINSFASAIFDYTVLVVASEMRHCKDKASHYINGYYTSYQKRNEVFRDCLVYRATDILIAGARMFDTCHVIWDRNYGGFKWKQISKAGLMKGKVSDLVFIDHCVDLSHNNSVYFDKGAGIFMLRAKEEYQRFLYHKRACAPEALIESAQGDEFNQLLRRANNLSIINAQAKETSDLIDRNRAESQLLSYIPIKWGNERLNYSEYNIFSGNVAPDGRERVYREIGSVLLKCA